MKSLFSKVFFVAISLTFLTSCVETVIVGSVAGGAAVTREKTISDTQKDVVIATKLGTEFFANGLKNPFNSIDITVNEGRILLTGITTDLAKAKLANDLSWKVAGVKEVIDEIQIMDDKTSLTRRTSIALSDYLITSAIETKLFVNTKIRSFNYQITTVNKSVYILGVARNKTELNAVLDIVSRGRGIEKVINHAILADDSRRHGGAPKKGAFKEEDEVIN